MIGGNRRIRLPVLALFLVLSLIAAACSNGIQVQTKYKGFTAVKEESIDINHIMDTIAELSSPKYQGRLVGTEGNRLAADYIADYFKEVGLQSPEGVQNYQRPYEQTVMMTHSTPVLQLVDEGNNIIKSFKYIDEFSVRAYNGMKLRGTIAQKPVIIQNTSELHANNVNLKNKLVLVPMNIWGSIGTMSQMIDTLTQCGAAGILYEIDLNNPNFPYKHLVVAPNAAKDMVNNENGPLTLRVEGNAFNEIAAEAARGNSVQITLNNSIEAVRPSNVIGLIPGNDGKLKNEYIIIGAHFDHVGDNKNGTFNPGAFDNGSGIAVLLDIARILSQSSIPPKKSILFIAFNGEEEGLYGAYDYANNPIYPLEKSIVINLDMIGSKTVMPLSLCNASEQDIDLIDDLYRYAGDLGIIVEKIQETGSDHAPFALKGVQAVTLINLDITNPGYHTYLDTIDRTVDSNRLKEAAKLLLYYIDNEAF